MCHITSPRHLTGQPTLMSQSVQSPAQVISDLLCPHNPFMHVPLQWTHPVTTYPLPPNPLTVPPLPTPQLHLLSMKPVTWQLNPYSLTVDPSHYESRTG